MKIKPEIITLYQLAEAKDLITSEMIQRNEICYVCNSLDIKPVYFSEESKTLLTLYYREGAINLYVRVTQEMLLDTDFFKPYISENFKNEIAYQLKLKEHK